MWRHTDIEKNEKDAFKSLLIVLRKFAISKVLISSKDCWKTPHNLF